MFWLLLKYVSPRIWLQKNNELSNLIELSAVSKVLGPQEHTLLSHITCYSEEKLLKNG